MRSDLNAHAAAVEQSEGRQLEECKNPTGVKSAIRNAVSAEFLRCKIGKRTWRRQFKCVLRDWLSVLF
jgi:hypothetical protein